ncbi:MAG TPA: tRNA preQ1(34) S-adenosylmethionine ribosyltransferase-isomerase QueA [Elusimicrobia bacterium]|nr:tRNA preQ1(34) S-adenosylmethionine ribosyltransferase-isomerase QueA [Elusimicrobiota bacterium]
MNGPHSFRLDDYAFSFPESLIAAAPPAERDEARLLVLNRKTGESRHERFAELAGHLRAGDCLVLNRSRVLSARLIGRKTTGGKVDLLLLREVEPGTWTALSTDLKAGVDVLFPDGVRAEAAPGTDGWTLRFSTADVLGLLSRHGLAPLPPYILKRRKALSAAGAPGPCDPAADRERYQTVYAREAGSIAAPTAGLHFTPPLLAALKERGVRVAEVVLHVGRGTFMPVTAPDIREHAMPAERFELPPASAEAVERTREEGGRVVAVGTSATRVLESAGDAPLRALADGGMHSTDLFILPGHRFRWVDVLITNFHQPTSTPLILASAFAGRERILAAYREAVERQYRLFSFGDSMLIL